MNFNYLLFLLIFGLFSLQIVVNAAECENSDSPILCHSTRVVRSVIEHVLNSSDDNTTNLNLVPGIDIVEVPRNNSDLNDAKVNKTVDNSYMGRVSRYLQRHELKIQFPQIVARSEIENDILNDTIKDDGITEGRKKDKGFNMVLMLALMMKKMLAALGIAAIGALAVKALGIALIAFLLASLIGLKKLTDTPHDDGGGGGGHHVQYVTAHTEHHRQKREIDNELPLPYRGWVKHSTV